MTAPIEQILQALHAAEPAPLADAVSRAGFAEPGKTVANLQLLSRLLDDPALLAALIATALETADPDLALNNLERLTDTVARDVLLPPLTAAEPRRCLLTILGASPFLASILLRNDRYLAGLLHDRALWRQRDLTAMLADLRAAIDDRADFATLQQGLRRFKAAEMLRIGGRDLCRLADLEEVMAELTALAAASLQRAHEVCDRLLRSEYGAPLLATDAGDAPAEAEFTIFAMGKFGAGELNFSSDVDLIYFYSSDRGETAGTVDAAGNVRNRISLHQYFVKLAEMISKAIGQPTADGFVFRVDLRLRPEGHSGELANSLAAAEIYYESWGQSWERAAMLKARPVAGSIALGEELLQRLEPFIYRRHLDYAMIEDIKVMKQKIDHNLAREREGASNLKLGHGGIREIEFFIQALQLINAGKRPELRERNSLQALQRLCSAGLISDDECADLSAAYRFLRTVEHRIQVVHEQQTHNLPARSADLRALARRCGFTAVEAFQTELAGYRQRVSAMFRDLFYTSDEELPSRVSARVMALFDANAEADLCMDILEEKGFRDPRAAYDSLLVLRRGGTRGYLTARARRQLDRIAPLLFQEVLESPEPDMALRNLEQFLEACRRARGTFYALLAENPEIVKLLVGLFATSQFLSRQFIRHPEILDQLVSHAYAEEEKDGAELAAELEGRLAALGEYEDRLDGLRRFRNEEFLRLAFNDISGKTSQASTTRQLSLLADVCLQQATAIARQELLPRFGLPFCRGVDGALHEAGFVIVGMGKLGGMELNYHSDLDLIFLYEDDGETVAVDGTDAQRFKGQGNQQYFGRLAQRIISILTLKTREGSVYQIDTRLRPSGNQGPLVSSLPAFRAYHESSAAPWERQSLIKARVVAGAAGLAAAVDRLIEEIVYLRPLPEQLAGEIVRLRQRMESELAREGAAQFNIKTGRGGMVDVEFLVQYLQLCHGRTIPALRCRNTLAALDALLENGLLPATDHAVLANGYRFLRRLENKLRLVHDQSISELSGSPEELAKLARRLGYPDRPRPAAEALRSEYETNTQQIRSVFTRHLPVVSSD
ncbi:MAG: bifunctional [glutamate--ammonia ligase]-adenylyl-L-tyrosine phosphorylase/[glutamate--ammonia-ligase] adenylyltransferase [Desulfuromonadales bacterium]|nr:bifunctional [glutamate--ammonia ligase]-adenylyl-L-tyrosine phosphorylase/[glutamate--ammonia-ligase] adenylyltransferase [Desulfuromonadales bacterium]